MNSLIEDSLIKNLKTAFPNSRIFSGKVIQGTLPKDIIYNDVLDEIKPCLGSVAHERHTIVSVSLLGTTATVLLNTLIKAVSFFTIDDLIIYPDSLNIQIENGNISILLDISHVEP